ncbi:hypothetical protein N9H39_03235 [Gammaproteobacteria bacterium]|nr:hypothetical protein [Gammaproteobacteria bacterium]
MDDLQAEYFLKARQQNKTQQPFQFESKTPASLAEAYAIQHHNYSNIGQSKGWKLGGTTSLTQAMFDTNATYYGPIYQASIYESKNPIELPDWMNNPRGEAEVCFELSDKVKGLSDTTMDEIDISEFIVNIMPSIELPWSVFPLPAAGLNVLIADQCGTGALVFGDRLPYSSTHFPSLSGEVMISSTSGLLTEGSIEDILAGPLTALADFLRLAQQHQLQIKSGDFVATGGCTPCIELPLNRKITVDMTILGEFSFILN